MLNPPQFHRDVHSNTAFQVNISQTINTQLFNFNWFQIIYHQSVSKNMKETYKYSSLHRENLCRKMQFMLIRTADHHKLLFNFNNRWKKDSKHGRLNDKTNLMSKCKWVYANFERIILIPSSASIIFLPHQMLLIKLHNISFNFQFSVFKFRCRLFHFTHKNLVLELNFSLIFSLFCVSLQSI